MLSDLDFISHCNVMPLETRNTAKRLYSLIVNRTKKKNSVDGNQQQNPKHTNHKKDQKTVTRGTFALLEAMELIHDPMIATRAHGLVQLRELVLSHDADVMDKLDSILEEFKKNLEDDDDSVYLGAIGGLSAIGDVALDTVLPTLQEIFLNTRENFKHVDGGDATSGTCNISGGGVSGVRCVKVDQSGKGGHLKYSQEVRLKVGEVLVKISQRLGELMPHYSGRFLSTFLLGAKDSSPMIQASSLVNLGQVCRLLDYAIQPFVEEIMDGLYNILLDPRLPFSVHQGALVVLEDILVGLDKKVIVILKPHLSKINQLLLQISQIHPDDVCRGHASCGLHTLSSILERVLVDEEISPPRVVQIVKFL
eukprot:TRINITY_DN5352_c0_g1_i20.p2 TRINITY_DN5352_c0_g1~~TRINITY_DN5352_c0_g1_i20.p2  ORF type:complete len:365 (-),score=93.61 TRINITY_DN5352_c0_g1_i20:229-1323(-)